MHLPGRSRWLFATLNECQDSEFHGPRIWDLGNRGSGAGCLGSQNNGRACDPDDLDRKRMIIALIVLSYVALGAGVGFGLDIACEEKILRIGRPSWPRVSKFIVHLIFWPSTLMTLVTLVLCARVIE